MNDQQYWDLYNAGRCTNCGIPREPGHALCEDCAAKRAGWPSSAAAYAAAGVALEQIVPKPTNEFLKMIERESVHNG